MSAAFVIVGALSTIPIAFSNRVVESPHKRVGDPTVRTLVVENMFFGTDVLRSKNVSRVWDGWDEACKASAITNVAESDIGPLVYLLDLNVTFWVELGSFHGGSAIRTANVFKKLGLLDVTLLCVDTFLGSGAIHNDYQLGLYDSEGVPRILDQFIDKIHSAGHDDIILAWPQTTMLAMHALHDSFFSLRPVPRPDVIYLDSAHISRETLLELELAWTLLPRGGILFGDDFSWESVSQDVMQFAMLYRESLDLNLVNDFSKACQLGRRGCSAVQFVKPGLAVSFPSHQWIMRKNADPGYDKPSKELHALRGQFGNWATMDCFGVQGFSKDSCCGNGPPGNHKCWDVFFTFEKCCH